MNPTSPPGNKPSLAHWEFPDDHSANQTYLLDLESLQKIFIDIQRDAFSMVGFDQFVQTWIDHLQQNVWGLFRVFLDQRVYRASTASACLNTSLVAYIVATTHDWKPQDIHQFIRASLLHDIGMLFLPPAVLMKEGKLSEKERAILEAHPSVSFELIKKWGESFESTLVAVQHHEEWNGTGYPAHLSGTAIHPWAALISVCINFVARVTQRGYRNSLVGYEAVKQLIKDQNVRFSPTAVKQLVHSISLYPPGSILLLSDGSIARVLSVTKQNVMRPQIRLLIDHFGNPFRDDRGPHFDLADAPKLFIARPVNFADLLQQTEHVSEG